MEIYYVYSSTSDTIIIATDGTKAVKLTEISPDELGWFDPITEDEVKSTIGKCLSDDCWYPAFWYEFFPDAFFPASEIPTRYPNAKKYTEE